MLLQDKNLKSFPGEKLARKATGRATSDNHNIVHQKPI
jgi:hypothetical protein